VRVTKRTAAAVAAYPESLTIRLARGQTVASGLVQVRRPGGGLVRIEKVESPHSGLQTRWTSEAGPVGTIRVIVDAEQLQGGGRAELRVLLSDPAGQAVTVPVTWIIR
jgi:hypothetical protein